MGAKFPEPRLELGIATVDLAVWDYRENCDGPIVAKGGYGEARDIALKLGLLLRLRARAIGGESYPSPFNQPAPCFANRWVVLGSWEVR